MIELEIKVVIELEIKVDSMVGEIWIDVDIKVFVEKFYYMFVKRLYYVFNVIFCYIGGVELYEGEWDKVGSIVLWNYIYGN